MVKKAVPLKGFCWPNWILMLWKNNWFTFCYQAKCKEASEMENKWKNNDESAISIVACWKMFHRRVLRNQHFYKIAFSFFSFTFASMTSWWKWWMRHSVDDSCCLPFSSLLKQIMSVGKGRSRRFCEEWWVNVNPIYCALEAECFNWFKLNDLTLRRGRLGWKMLQVSFIIKVENFTLESFIKFNFKPWLLKNAINFS